MVLCDHMSKTFCVLLASVKKLCPKSKCFFSKISKKFHPVKLFDTFLINLTRNYDGSLVLTALFPIPTSVIPRLSFFWTSSLMLSANEKNKKRWIVVSRRKPKKWKAVLKSEKASRWCSLWRKYCTASSSVNRTNKEEISLPKSCNVCWYFIDQRHGYLYDYIKYNSHSIWT